MAQPCRFFAQGRCNNGDACRFSHEMDATPAPHEAGVAAPVEGPTPASPSKGQPCRFFAQGRCNAGDACRFSHDPASVPQQAARLGDDRNRVQLPEILGPLYSIDVECVATGTRHHERSIAQVGLVDSNGSPILNVYIRPDAPVVSYLSPITGLSAELIAQRGIALADGLAQLRARLPPGAYLVGQNILKDIEWLGLREGVDYACALDLAALFRVWTERGYSYFSQDHIASVWLRGTRFARELGAAHDAVADAATSMALFHAYRQACAEPGRLAQLQQATLSAPKRPSFAMQNPVFEGVCQGGKRTCVCGGPFFG